jgi:LAO/AO transport system ATPase
MPDLASLLDRFRHGDRLALSRLLSLAARNEQIQGILAGVAAPGRSSKVIAITGSAGVGKSTLIGKLIEHIRKQDQKVAVLACDPQSPVSGGALLGDRFRMPASPDDDGVFIRSLAALSGHGAVAEHLPLMVRLLAAFGFDVILIETVGAGQGDVTVAGLADVVLLLLQPETGDDLQWEKAGVLEVADVIAVQKADLPRAEQVAAQVRSILELSGTKPVPVLLVSAKTGQGIAELWHKITEVGTKEYSRQDISQELLRAVQEEIAAQWAALRREQPQTVTQLAQQWERGTLTQQDAISSLLRLVLSRINQH